MPETFYTSSQYYNLFFQVYVIDGLSLPLKEYVMAIEYSSMYREIITYPHGKGIRFVFDLASQFFLSF